jgi:hypothetical protein
MIDKATPPRIEHQVSHDINRGVDSVFPGQEPGTDLPIHVLKTVFDVISFFDSLHVHFRGKLLISGSNFIEWHANDITVRVYCLCIGAIIQSVRSKIQRNDDIGSSVRELSLRSHTLRISLLLLALFQWPV